MDAVEDVKGRISIEDVVGEYVQLKRAGRNFRGLSPFTNERTPSFMVSPEKQIWHDFSSGKGGSAFNFVMEMEGVDFKTALEILARKAGVDLTQYQKSGSGQTAKTKERLYNALELATRFYQIQFTKNRTALDYILKERLFSRETALLFKVGYSPNTGDSLLKFLTKKGFTIQELQQAGLANRNYRQVGDMFRGRIMIPLADSQGRIIGFTARLLLKDDNGPKYINTPQTLIYDKSRHVFGLHLAKEAIRRTNYVVVVEGNLDVIASHQAGVSQVVATAGTAVTEQQIKILANFTSDIRLAFDQDAAGQTATERTIPVAAKTGINLGVISIDNAKDPDELIKKDIKSWLQAIEKPIYALDWLMTTHMNKVDIKTAVGKRYFSDAILPFISRLPDPVEQDHNLSYLSDTIKVSKSALQAKTDNTKNYEAPVLRRKVEQKELDKDLVEQTKNQDQILALALVNPELRKYIEPFSDDMLMSDNAKLVFNFINNNFDFKGDPLTDPHLSKSSDYVKMLMLQYETLYQDLDQNELIYEAKRLQDRLITKYVKTKKGTLATAIHGAGKGDVNDLLEQDKKLNNLLKQSKEVLHG